MSDHHILPMHGCTPVPLAGYLKALGIFRLVAEQAEPSVSGWWENDVFTIRSRLSREGLAEFFLNQYRPTPLVAPWNGGSGFFPKDSQEAIKKVMNGTAVRFEPYRQLIQICRTLLSDMGLSEKPDELKSTLLQNCRNRFPDDALGWLDAAFLLTSDGPKYPPLLGTGGNDGRLEFTNNYMQRLTELFDTESEHGSPFPASSPALAESLFGEMSTDRSVAPVGQFDPGSAGGPNSASGFDASPGINLWDFIFTLEGTIAFAAASVRKLESSDFGSLSFPFCVRTSGVGYASAARTDEAASRSEMWLPLWRTPSSYEGVRHLLSEGRAQIHRRRVRNGVDFARAVATLGVDRGISDFQRFGFQQRNGLSYFAVPLGRFQVRESPRVRELLPSLDHWLDRFRRAATSKTAPARAGHAIRRLDTSILKFCRHAGRRETVDLLTALGEAETALATSPRLREDARVSPLLLKPAWITQSNLRCREFRLAAALASIRHAHLGPIRRHLEPISPPRPTAEAKWSLGNPHWANNANDPGLVTCGGGLIRMMHAVLQRRIVEDLGRGRTEVTPTFPSITGTPVASFDDIAAFIEGRVDDQLIEDLFRALTLIDWRRESLARVATQRASKVGPDAAYSLLKLCHLPFLLLGKSIPLTPEIVRRAVSGDDRATQVAARRLRASGFPPAVKLAHCPPERLKRIAAALLFPIPGQWNDSLKNVQKQWPVLKVTALSKR